MGQMDKIAILTFKSIIGLAPDYLCHLFNTFTPSRSLRSSDQGLLPEPRVGFMAGSRSFSYAAAVTWNSLPLSLRESSNFNIFKSGIKTYLLTEYFKE